MFVFFHNILTMMMKATRFTRYTLVSFVVLQQSMAILGYSLQPGTFVFQGHPIHYESAHFCVSTDDGSSRTQGSPVLLLNGFGVGSFHQHNLVKELIKDSKNNEESRSIYCMDYLGQGKSWPKDCNDGDSASERELRYCGTTWVNQIIAFIETVIQKESNNSQTKVHIVGNSVGGHLAVCIAAFRPDLVESLCLLNATPVWGLNLPGWSGHLPAPSIPRKVGRAAFDWIRDPNTIQQYLQAAYCNMEAVDDELIAQIRSCTEGPGGHAAFSSIMWSPPVQVTLKNGEQQATFDDCLRALECDVLLLFGRDDPWCKPAFAKRMLRDLLKRSLVSNDDDDIIITQRYVELQDVGHCPNHEAPVAVATVLSKWLDAKNGRGEGKLVLFPEDEMVTERWGQTVIRERKEEEIPLSLIDRLAITFV